MSFKILDIAHIPARIRLVKRTGARVGFSDNLTPSGVYEDDKEVVFNLAPLAARPYVESFVFATSKTPNIAYPDNYATFEDEAIWIPVTPKPDMKLQSRIITNDLDPNYNKKNVAIFYRMQSDRGPWQMATPGDTLKYRDATGAIQTIKKSEILKSPGVWFTDRDYYVKIYEGTLANLMEIWTKPIEMLEMKTSDWTILENELYVKVQKPIEEVYINGLTNMIIGDSQLVRATYSPAVAEVVKTTYTSSSPEVAYFPDNDNRLVARFLGYTTITVTMTDVLGNEVSATQEIFAKPNVTPMTMRIAPGKSSINFNHTFNIGADGRDGYIATGDGRYMNLESNLTIDYDTQKEVTLDYYTNKKTNSLTILGDNLTEIVSWGSFNIERFRLPNNRNLVKIPTRMFSSLTTMEGMFEGCAKFNSTIDLRDAKITGASRAFKGCKAFNSTLANMAIPDATSATEMFQDCVAFNQRIDYLKLNRVGNLTRLMKGCTSFNQPAYDWVMPANPGKSVIDVTEMFADCTSFNQPYNAYFKLSTDREVTIRELSGCYKNCTSLNQPPVANIKIKSGFHFDSFFEGCTSFNQPLTALDLTDTPSLASMFRGCVSFNQSVNGVGGPRLVNTSMMFDGCTRFNGTMTDFVFDNVINAGVMFRNCKDFNQDISDWKTSKLTTAQQMFYGATKFNQPIKWWCVSGILSEPSDFATNSGLALANYPMWGTCPNRGVEITIDQTIPFYRTGESGTFTFTAKPTTPPYPAIWSSSNSSVIAVDATTGQFTVTGVGVATIKVKLGELYEDSITYETFVGGDPMHILTASHGCQIDAKEFRYPERPATRLFVRANGDQWAIIEPGDKVSIKALKAPYTVEIIPDSVNGGVVTLTSVVKEVVEFGNLDFEINSLDLVKVPNKLHPKIKRFMFTSCYALNDPNISEWDISNVKNLSEIFYGCKIFNQPLNKWKTDHVINLNLAFCYAEEFNQDISMWDVGNVTAFNSTFLGAKKFNQNIGRWNTRSSMTFTTMFSGATNFNRDLAWWCVENIKNPPSDFAKDSALLVDNYPRWGTCPNYDSTLFIRGGLQKIPLGTTAKFDYLLEPDFKPATVEWSTSDVEVATVDQTGLVTPIKTDVFSLSVTINNRRTTSLNLEVVNKLTLIGKTASEGGIHIYSESNLVVSTSSKGVIGHFRPTDDIYQLSNGTALYGWSIPGNNVSFSIGSRIPGTPIKGLIFASNQGGLYHLTAWPDDLVLPFTDSKMIPAQYQLGACVLSVPSTLPTTVTTAHSMFYRNKNITALDLSGWDVSRITDFTSMFDGCINLKTVGCSNWKFPAATSMAYMFHTCHAFTDVIDNWGVKNIVNFSNFLMSAKSFTGNLIGWRTTAATNMDRMFYGCEKFTSNLKPWCVSKITKIPDGWNIGNLITTANNPTWGKCSMYPLSATYSGNTVIGVGETSQLSVALTPSSYVPHSKVWSSSNPTVATVDQNGTVTGIELGRTTITCVIDYWLTVEIDTFQVHDPTFPNESGELRVGVRSGWELYVRYEKATPDNQIVITAPNGSVRTVNIDTTSTISDSSITSGVVSFKILGTPIMVQVKGGNIQNYGQYPYRNLRIAGTILGTPLPEHIPNYLRNLNNMFSGAPEFVGQVSKFDTRFITSMYATFEGCYRFNSPMNVKSWDLSKCTSIERMFAGCKLFNQPLNNWNTSNITSFESTFSGASAFNGDIENWDISSGTDFGYMFNGAASFARNLSKWTPKNARNMVYMFYDASVFSSDLKMWCVTNVKSHPSGFNTGSRLRADQFPMWGSCPNPLSDIYATGPSTVKVGGSIQLTPQIKPVGFNGAVVWSSSNPSIATVDQTGKVTGLKDGYVDIIVTLDGWKESRLENIIVGKPPKLVGDYTLRFYANADSRLTLESFDQLTFTVSVKWGDGQVTNIPSRNGKVDISAPTSLKENTLSEIYFADPEHRYNIRGMEFRFISGIKTWGGIERPTKVKLTGLKPLSAKVPRHVPTTLHPNFRSLEKMFEGESGFNDSLDGWDVSNVEILAMTFKGCTSFNQDLSSWVTTNILWMPETFRDCSQYNHDLSGWNFSQVIEFAGFLRDASNYSHDMSNLCIPVVKTFTNFATGSKLTPDQIPTPGTCPLSPQRTSPMILGGSFSKEAMVIQTGGDIHANPQTQALYQGNVEVVTDTGKVIKQVNYQPITVQPDDYKEYVSLTVDIWDGELPYVILKGVGYIQHWGTYPTGPIIFSDSPVIKVNRRKVPGYLPEWMNSLEYMFASNDYLYDDIHMWDLKNIKSIEGIFMNARFGEPVEEWDVSNVKNFNKAFYNTRNFNRDLSGWCTSEYATHVDFSTGSVLTPAQLPKWGTCPNPKGMSLRGVVGKPCTVRIDVDTISLGEPSYVKFKNGDTVEIGRNSKGFTTFTPTAAQGAEFDLIIPDLDPKTLTQLTLTNIAVGSWGYSRFKRIHIRGTLPTGRQVPNYLPYWMTDIEDLFKDCANFNTDISMWDVSRVTIMRGLFDGCIAFNQDLSGWDVRNVSDFGLMFNRCAAFTSDLSRWKTYGCHDRPPAFSGMFNGCSKFKSDLTNWCTRTTGEPSGGFNRGGILTAAELPKWGTCPDKLPMVIKGVVGTTAKIGVSSAGFNGDEGNGEWWVEFGDGTTQKLPVTGRGVHTYSLSLTAKTGPYIKLHTSHQPATATGKIEFTNIIGVRSWGNIAGGTLRFLSFTDTPRELQIPPKLHGRFKDLISWFDGSTINAMFDGWDTRYIAHMTYMFRNCKNMNHISGPSLNGWDTRYCSGFTGMFQGASSIVLNLGNWDVSRANQNTLFGHPFKDMFVGATKVNHDLSFWCVPDLEPPATFAGSSGIPSTRFPSWGYCPPRGPMVIHGDIGRDISVDITTGEIGKLAGFAMLENGQLVELTTGKVNYLSPSLETGTRFEIIPAVPNLKIQLSRIRKLTSWGETPCSVEFVERHGPLPSDERYVPTTIPPHMTSLAYMFYADEYFNDDISSWNVSNVTNMSNMFWNASSFSKDLSKWCVTKIKTKPEKFDEGSALTPEQLPVWGTCPKN